MARMSMINAWHGGVVVVTGTDTGVGKTIVAAALAVAGGVGGARVAVVKPAQTGADSDEAVIRRLAAPVTVRTLAKYPDPLAPLAAARAAGLPPLDLSWVVAEIGALVSRYDLVLIEGAGGLLVPMGPGWTVADLALALGAPAVVVVRAGLGTLNHTALTLEALERRGIPASVVVGAWPAEPELVHRSNLDALGPSVVGVLPEGAGSLDPAVFRRSAPGWFAGPVLPTAP